MFILSTAILVCDIRPEFKVTIYMWLSLKIVIIHRSASVMPSTTYRTFVLMLRVSVFEDYIW